MAHVVVLGAGLGGTIMAYEMKAKLGRDDRLEGGCVSEPVSDFHPGVLQEPPSDAQRLRERGPGDGPRGRSRLGRRRT